MASAPRGPPEPGVPGLFDPLRAAAQTPRASSPAPAQDFAGLDDIGDLSTGYRVIPPDTDGAVGRTKPMSGLNNDYRIFTKATGAVVSTVGAETFWRGLGGSDERLQPDADGEVAARARPARAPGGCAGRSRRQSAPRASVRAN